VLVGVLVGLLVRVLVGVLVGVVVIIFEGVSMIFVLVGAGVFKEFSVGLVAGYVSSTD
jgi:hypothetical protein